MIEDMFNFQVPEGFDIPEGSTLVGVQFEGDENITAIPMPGHENIVVSPVIKCFLFPPVGEQTINMGLELYEHNEHFRDAMQLCNESSKQLLPMELIRVLYPTKRDTPMCQEAINTAQYAQPCLFAVEYSMYAMCLANGLAPDLVIGHSVGEIMCAVAAGFMDMPAAMELVCTRATLMHNTPSNGSMIAVATSSERCEAAIAAVAATDSEAVNRVAVASVNTGTSTVLSGDWATLSDVIDQLPEDVKTIRVSASHADHSPLMEVISSPLKQKAEQLSSPLMRAEMFLKQNDQSRDVVVLSTVTGAALEGPMDSQYWVTHNENRVRFSDALKAACGIHDQMAKYPKSAQHKDPVLYLIDMGGGTLARFAAQIIGETTPDETKPAKRVLMAACLGSRKADPAGKEMSANEHISCVIDECKDLVQQAELNEFMLDPMNASIPSGFAHMFQDCSVLPNIDQM